MILDTFPTAEEFYKTYWGKKPFIVRGYIPATVIDNLVDGDTLAGLALEEEIKSRIITNNPEGNEWKCEHGPFEESRFDDIGDKDWSLLVQDVEQYHTDTAQLLSYFQFSPRWLLDDIMVSFSAPGGSVGPHTDSYHTFLVQGIGKRAWKISADKIEDDRYADNLEMKVLQHGFEGETYEVTAGDVIYMPPFFGHEGKTIDAAMTFSVGFLGPKLSEMLSDYAQYLEENEALDKRYLGEDLNTSSAGFSIDLSTQENIRKDALSAFNSDDFAIWMAEYFSASSHEVIEGMQISNGSISGEDLLGELRNGNALIRPEQIKISITKSAEGDSHLSVHGEALYIPIEQSNITEALNLGHEISIDIIEVAEHRDDILTLVTALYNNNIITFKSEI